MGQKKDIGTLFEKKLNDGKKSANQNLWEKINHSLDEETRKQRRIFFYWLIGGGLLVSMGLLLLIVNGSFSETNPNTNQNNTPLTEQSNPLSEEKNNKALFGTENNEASFEVSKQDSLSIKNIDETLSKIEAITESSEIIENSQKKNQSTKTVSNNKSKKNTSNKKSIDEVFSVTTKYYYYNSEDGKRIETNDKNIIDSLISIKNQSLDSVTTKTIDSLN